MLSSSSLFNTGKILLGVLVGALSIMFNSQEEKRMNNNKYLGLRTVAYAVTDLDKAKKWYTNAFETEPYFDESYYVGFNIRGYELGLFPVEKQHPRSENVISYWGVDNIDETYQYLVANGAEPGEAPKDVGDGILVAHVFDPWGNAVGIIYNPHFRLPNEAKNQAAVEWAPFKLKEGVSDADLKNASAAMQQDFLVKQKGFIRRNLLKRNDGKWVDLVFWESQADADQAIKNAETSAACGQYFDLMNFEDNTEGISHLELIDQY